MNKPGLRTGIELKTARNFDETEPKLNQKILLFLKVQIIKLQLFERYFKIQAFGIIGIYYYYFFNIRLSHTKS